MSRIGKRTIAVPKGVTVTLDGQTVSVKGPKGESSWTVAEEIEVTREGDELSLGLRSDTQRGRAMWGLSRTLVDNMVVGVTTGFEKSLELVGVGYRAAMKGNALSLQLGFSHEVDIDPPAGVLLRLNLPLLQFQQHVAQPFVLDLFGSNGGFEGRLPALGSFRYLRSKGFLQCRIAR